MQAPTPHTTVLLDEAVNALVQSPAGCYVDATFGRGGHSRAILQRLDSHGRLWVYDKDPQAIAVATELQLTDSRLEIRHEGFENLGALADQFADGILMDLGVSSPQIDAPERGFSFRFDGPLDMRMDNSKGPTVAQWLSQASTDEITEVIRDYGEERFAGPIAKAIVARRQERGPLLGTQELAQIVATAVRTREPGQSPATRTFQAFRIFINRELEELERALEASLRVLRPGGRLVVISFHSLEDRIVKQFIAKHAKESYDRRMPMAPPRPCLLSDLGRTKPSAHEVTLNPRSRSAVMRVAQRSAL
jgi:16S rRNA (cytosine1402-N4)-methyltransferase